MIGFKVVRKLDNGLVSATYLGRVLNYTPNIPTTPLAQDGPIAVFRTQAFAKSFAIRESASKHLLVYECEYTPSEHKDLWIIGRYDNKSVFAGLQLPVGTELACQVVLVGEPLYDTRQTAQDAPGGTLSEKSAITPQSP